jgi:uncharacterized protein YdbL (DUF1318 family)
MTRKENTMRRILPLKLALVSLVVAACVTINVYFPAAAAEKAADQIIDTVTNRGVAMPVAPSQTAPQPATVPPTSRLAPTAHGTLAVLASRTLSLLVPAASAQTANLDVSSNEIRALTASMQQRFSQLSHYFDTGVVGLTSDGMVEVRDQNAAALAERATVKRLVAEDNKDRSALYAEIARANGHAEWEADIRKTFARRWIERGAQPGWYYQDAAGAWQRK